MRVKVTKKVSSPGQVFLFGEHAVVHGQPALATAIDVRTEVSGEPLENDRFVADAEGVGRAEGKIKKSGETWSIEEMTGDVEDLSFVTKVSELTYNHLQEARGLRLEIESGLPPGSGLGSSSAVTTATAAAVSTVLDRKLSRDEISQLAYDAEVEVQGAASRTGVNVATYGGFLRVQEDDRRRIEGLSEPDLIIGYTGKYANTAELVAGVRELKEEKPWIVDSIIQTIGKITEVGIDTLEDGDLRKLGVLMNANQNLLEGLKVSSPELRDLISSAREAGAIGAKLTGAGGGGCMIALASGNVDEIASAIEEEGGEPMKAKIGSEGLKY